MTPPERFNEDRLGDDSEAACAVCGCTEERACAGGCCWVRDPKNLMRDICSRCAMREALAEDLARCSSEIAKIETANEPGFGAIIGLLDWHAERAQIIRGMERHLGAFGYRLTTSGLERGDEGGAR
jgi:hypothetical protein